MKPIKAIEHELGAAGITITLDRGTITVRHSEDGTILHEVKHAKAGSWDKIWDTIHSIEQAKWKTVYVNEEGEGEDRQDD